MKQIAVVLGTRPEIIKMSPVLRLLERTKRPHFLLHTGQHYSHDMDQQFFEDLELSQPRHKLVRPRGLGANKHAELVEWMRERIQGVLEKEKPGTVLVQGDTDTVLAGALAAAEVGGITIGHVEAGLRSYDSAMPEERNRVEADKLSHILFAPTEGARKNLLKEKLDKKKIEVTGNTIVDALFENLEIARKRAPRDLPKAYVLVTLHRPESVDNKERLGKAMLALEMLAKKKGLKIVFPVHPRTRQRLEEFGIKTDEKFFSLLGPMGFLEFIQYEKNASLIVTNSGGVQEEACILKVPCVTVRTTTERPETVDAGANVIAGYEPEQILALSLRMLEKPKDWPNPFGDGKAAQRILKALEEMG